MVFIGALQQIISALVRGFTSSIGEMVKVGGNLIKGLWQGIADAEAWLWSKISGLFTGVVNKIKGFFGIHSPSELFAGIGQSMGEGIGVGFQEAMDQVSLDMQRALPSSIGEMSVNGVGAGSPSAGTVINQSISITSPKALSEKEAAREFQNLSRRLALGV